MSIKKATPKAVFDACEQLELLDKSWNRDDVRALIGGGSFSVIDPLIRAWRQLQPVREVAPTVPTDLLIQIATMLERQVSEFIGDIEARDQAREETLLSLNENASEIFSRREAELETQIDLAKQANHQLEAELSRLEGELRDKEQLTQTLNLKLKVAEESTTSLTKQFKEKKEFYDAALKEQKAEHRQIQLNESVRITESFQRQIAELKQEHQEQLARQKSELIESAEMAENRLMRLLDLNRIELKELGIDSNKKIELLRHELQEEKQLSHTQKLEINALNASLIQTKNDSEIMLSNALHENAALRKQLENSKTEESKQEKTDLQQLKESIRLLQDQVKSK